MRTIDRSSAFKRDFKKHGDIDAALIEVLYKLLNDEVLQEKYRDPHQKQIDYASLSQHPSDFFGDGFGDKCVQAFIARRQYRLPVDFRRGADVE
jgi:hypothetical protein